MTGLCRWSPASLLLLCPRRVLSPRVVARPGRELEAVWLVECDLSGALAAAFSHLHAADGSGRGFPAPSPTSVAGWVHSPEPPGLSPAQGRRGALREPARGALGRQPREGSGGAGLSEGSGLRGRAAAEAGFGGRTERFPAPREAWAAACPPLPPGEAAVLRGCLEEQHHLAGAAASPAAALPPGPGRAVPCGAARCPWC